MSKSLGNVVLVRELLDQASGEVVRLALLSAHYRQPLDWNDDVLTEARRKLDRLYNALRSVSGWEDAWRQAEPSADFIEALEDDINTPRAFAALFGLAREINKSEDPAAALDMACQLRAGAELVGLLQSDPVAWFEAGAVTSDQDAAQIDGLLEQRTAARAAKDFAAADRIRDQLTEMGIVIEDSPEGPRWRRAGS